MEEGEEFVVDLYDCVRRGDLTSKDLERFRSCKVFDSLPLPSEEFSLLYCSDMTLFVGKGIDGADLGRVVCCRASPSLAESYAELTASSELFGS